MHIRQVKESDNLTLANLIRGVFVEHNAPTIGTVFSDPTTDNLYALFRNERSVLWVAEIDNQIMGCCGIFPTKGLPKGCVELVKFYLLKQARGKGIGKALMEKSMETAKELNYAEMYIESLSEFANAVKLYKKQGFLRLNKPLGYSGHSTCNIWLLKKL